MTSDDTCAPLFRRALQIHPGHHRAQTKSVLNLCAFYERYCKQERDVARKSFFFPFTPHIARLVFSLFFKPHTHVAFSLLTLTTSPLFAPLLLRLAGRQDIISVVIGENIGSIDEGAFNGCINLRRVTLPARSLEHIGTCASVCVCARARVATLTSCALPNRTLSVSCSHKSGSTFLTFSFSFLGTYAFYNCKALETLYIPGSVREIRVSAFSGCCSLRELTYPADIKGSLLV